MGDAAGNYRVVSLRSRREDLLIPWMALYETAFPPEERVMFSAYLKILKELEDGTNDTHRLLALVSQAESLDGIGCDQFFPQLSAGYLWYLAVRPGLRSQGVGTWFYRYLVDSLLERGRMVIFEVEKPALAETGGKRQLAERRIAFYRRSGAKLLEGIDYLQSVGEHMPPVPMHLMVHLKHSLPVEEVFSIARGIFHDALQPAGELQLL